MGEIAVVPNKMLLKFAVEFNNLQAATGNVDSIVTIIQDFEDYQSEAEMLHPEVKQALESMDSGFRLLKMVAQYSAGDLKIDDFDLNEMNNLLISSYKCKEIPNLFNECAIRLSKVFLQEKQFENARVLHILAIDSFKLLIENSKDPAPRKLGIEVKHDCFKIHFFICCSFFQTAVTSDLADQLLICEVQYLESLLLISSELVSTELCISQSTKAKKKKIGEKGLLHKMNVVENDIPHLAENLHDAKIIGEQIIQKLSEVNDAVDNTSSNQGTYYKSYVEAAQYYLISKFEPDLEKKGELLEQSIECYLTLKTEYFEAPKLQKFVDDSDGIAIGYYL